ncbi:alkyl hydroperoxide reductase/ Thiol specific antioxidant/ Mal allergen [Paludibacter propionicigenes WB4]|uniref:Alkyl hydroperoxide reductase/ Thiol specific antioxidant/ Mal allergen n=1 Tax=Paludibacter propionicigenes (strain DSM 17365 / JCM 13257 / WB4) TaxID=694427 RepID=E4T4W2_PALPW|nr:TlpA disulfide reductase family protein [Paludibacter propionicigenes]ADQ79756.1 alkyl hydroperoxide reductase/ Thiol specific antioxidant/ Mal allergen [Paludibacter propionicigenes WB4]
MKLNKKYWMVILLLVATMSILLAQQKARNKQTPPHFLINGEINLPSGTIYLKGFHNKIFFNIDSTQIINGHFKFKGSVKNPDLFGLSTDRNETFNPYYIFIENTPIKVLIDTANHHPIKIYGSASNDLFESFKAARRGYKIDSLITAQPQSPVAAYILYRNYANDLSVNQLEKNLALFDPSLADLSYIKELKEILAIKKQVDVGQKAIDFSALTPDGKLLKLSQFYGNYLLLDFWASWCGPCRRENPNLVRIYNKFKSKGFNIFAVSLDQKRENWIEAISKDNLTWTHVSDLKFWNSEPARLYAVRNIPSNVLIDPHGNIVARNLRGEELEKKLDEVFK